MYKSIFLFETKFIHDRVKIYSVGKTVFTQKDDQIEQTENETQRETKECYHSGSQTCIDCMMFEFGNMRIIYNLKVTF